MEPSKEFSRRAFVAGGPVFLVSVGIVMLLAGGLLALFAAGRPALVFAVVGLVLLLVGIMWGAATNRARSAPAE